MENQDRKKMWSSSLTPKTTKYYAIMHFINPEKTWNAYFKAMKGIERLASCISLKKTDDKSLRKILSLGNEVVESFSPEAATRMIAAMVPNECLSEAKTLLEWLGLYWDQTIPEADFKQLKIDASLMARLQEFSAKKSS